MGIPWSEDDRPTRPVSTQGRRRRLRRSQRRLGWPGLPAETIIDRFATVGAYCLPRSCTVESDCIIGLRSIRMEGSLLESHYIGSRFGTPPGRRVPTVELWAGNPESFVRTITYEETLEIPKLSVAINDLSRDYFFELLPYSTVTLEVEKLKKSLKMSI